MDYKQILVDFLDTPPNIGWVRRGHEWRKKTSVGTFVIRLGLQGTGVTLAAPFEVAAEFSTAKKADEWVKLAERFMEKNPPDGWSVNENRTQWECNEIVIALSARHGGLYLFNRSQRNDAPYVNLVCHAIPSALRSGMTYCCQNNPLKENTLSDGAGE